MLKAVLLSLVLAGGALASSPGHAYAVAAADCARLPKEIRPYTRYFSLYQVDELERANVWKALAFWVHSLSREAELYPPEKVTNTLFRVDIRNYAWDKEVWERFLEVEPYFHARLVLEEVVWVNEKKYYQAGYYDGKYCQAGYYDVQRAVKRKVKKVGQAPWLEPKLAAHLVDMTQSQVPVVRADWFIFQTAIQENRKAGYYDFLGLGNKEADFQDLVGADPARAKKSRREVAAILARSGVTLKNRAITRLGAINGGYWFTLDFKKSIGTRNVLRFLDKDLDPPKGDASEQYGFLPNGLFAFWLQNANALRQNVAPPFIASDKTVIGNDTQVHVGVSCIRCHLEGIRPIDDYARKLYHGTQALGSYDKKLDRRLRQLYLSDLQFWVERDRADYARVLFILTGLKTAEMARLFGRVWDDYAETELTLVDVARETGFSQEHVVAALRFARDNAPPLDPVLACLIADKPVPIIREHAEEVFPLLMTLLHGYIPAAEVKLK